MPTVAAAIVILKIDLSEMRLNMIAATMQAGTIGMISDKVIFIPLVYFDFLERDPDEIPLVYPEQIPDRLRDSDTMRINYFRSEYMFHAC